MAPPPPPLPISNDKEVPEAQEDLAFLLSSPAAGTHSSAPMPVAVPRTIAIPSALATAGFSRGIDDEVEAASTVSTADSLGGASTSSSSSTSSCSCSFSYSYSYGANSESSFGGYAPSHSHSYACSLGANSSAAPSAANSAPGTGVGSASASSGPVSSMTSPLEALPAGSAAAAPATAPLTAPATPSGGAVVDQKALALASTSTSDASKGDQQHESSAGSISTPSSSSDVAAAADETAVNAADATAPATVTAPASKHQSQSEEAGQAAKPSLQFKTHHHHHHHHRQSLSQGRRADLFLQLQGEEKDKWRETIEAANTHNARVTSDANRLPKSTGRQGIPAPAARPEELRAAANAAKGRWEEDETYERRRPSVNNGKKARMLRSVPCLIVSDIQQALPFYKEILSFVNVSKPDRSLASICRTPSGKPSVSGGEEGVHLYLRTAASMYGGAKPPGTSATAAAEETPMPPPMSLWIEVDNVDEMFTEILTKAQRTRPSEEDYFPAFHFGKARIDSRPTNTPFGTREIRVFDSDANLLVFFQDMKKDPPTRGGPGPRRR